MGAGGEGGHGHTAAPTAIPPSTPTPHDNITVFAKLMLLLSSDAILASEQRTKKFLEIKKKKFVLCRIARFHQCGHKMKEMADIPQIVINSGVSIYDTIFRTSHYDIVQCVMVPLVSNHHWKKLWFPKIFPVMISNFLVWPHTVFESDDDGEIKYRPLSSMAAASSDFDSLNQTLYTLVEVVHKDFPLVGPILPDALREIYAKIDGLYAIWKSPALFTFKKREIEELLQLTRKLLRVWEELNDEHSKPKQFVMSRDEQLLLQRLCTRVCQ
jgi:hypothetical protein